MAPKNKDVEYETVFLGDVETGNYATILGSPAYNTTIKSFKKGNHFDLPADQADEDFLNQYMHSGKSIATLMKTGFLTAHDLAMLDNTAGAVSELKEVGGEAGLETLLTLATPRKEAMKQHMLKKYDEIKKTPGATEGSMSKNSELHPGVQTYLWALDHAALLRARTRMRRRNLIDRKEWDLKYESLLRRGGPPLRANRVAADTFERVEEASPIPGRPYFEKGHICSYWYHPRLKHWIRLVGSARAVTEKRAMLPTIRAPVPSEEGADQTPIDDTLPRAVVPDKYATAMPADYQALFGCIDTQGFPTLKLHQVWMEYEYATPVDPGQCEGLCRFSDGWVLPEGSDGLPPQIQLIFTERGNCSSTHVLCGACNTRLCKRCYVLLQKYHTGNLGQMMNVYSRYRLYRKGHPRATYAEFLRTLPAADLETVPESPDLSFDWRLTDHPETLNDPDRTVYILRAIGSVKSRMRPLRISKGKAIPHPRRGRSPTPQKRSRPSSLPSQVSSRASPTPPRPSSRASQTSSQPSQTSQTSQGTQTTTSMGSEPYDVE